MAATIIASCASDSERRLETQALQAMPLNESAHLVDYVAGELSYAALVPTPAGLLLVGGAEAVDADGAFTPTKDITLIRSDSTTVSLESPLDTALANVEGSAFGRSAFVVGVLCETGTLQPDVGGMECTSGKAVLMHLDLDDLSWNVVELPSAAPEPAGFLGDQRVYALQDSVVYQVYAMAADETSEMHAWYSKDNGETWAQLPSGDAPAMCAANGHLIQIQTMNDDDATDLELTTGDATVDDPELQVRVLDADLHAWGDANVIPHDAPTVAGSLSVSCVPDVGVVAFTMTGGTSGEISIFDPNAGWHSVADAEGARYLDALPSFNSGLLVPAIGSGNLTRVDAAMTKEAIELPNDARPIAGIDAEILIQESTGVLSFIS